MCQGAREICQGRYVQFSRERLGVGSWGGKCGNKRHVSPKVRLPKEDSSAEPAARCYGEKQPLVGLARNPRSSQYIPFVEAS